MKKTLKQLKKESLELTREINRIEEEEIQKVCIPELKKLVGKYYAYRKNAYSCPEKPSDYWDVFRKIIDWVESNERGFHFIYEEFSIDSNGKISLEVEETYAYTNKEWWGKIPFSGYEEITSVEYDSEKAKMFSEMASQKKMRKAIKTNL